MKKLILFLLFVPFFSFSQSSMNMSLLGSLSYPTTNCSDIWGWEDGLGNEYALVGLANGFSCVNVTNPISPIEEFFISDLNSTWRDIKTWGNYAYVTTEANAGLLIVDLTDMTGNTYSHVTQFTNNSGGSLSFTSSHNIYIDENGIVYIFGAKNNGSYVSNGGAIFLDADANSTNPVYLGEWEDYYIHDGMARGDTMYVGCIYEGKMFVVDVSNKNNPQTLGSATTPNSFTHNAWVSDDGNYVFTTDETSDAYLAAYDISDINNIQEVDRIQSNPGSNSIPHNAHVDGNFLITSYYRDGTTVHDITYPNYMIEVAYYDSYAGSGNGFNGCWGAYPFLSSGNIISSDRDSDNGKGILNIYGRDFQQACYLMGNVTDGITSNFISNASIEILTTSINENTNLLGSYQTASVNSGTFQVVFSAPGYTSDTLTVSLLHGVMTILDAVLYSSSVTWDCDGQGNCYDPGAGNGQYSTLSSCQQNCISPSWDCDGQGSCSDPGTGNGQYSNQSLCQQNCIVPSWDCDGQGNCFDPGTGNGQYSNQFFCQQNCIPPSWDCNGQGNCFDPGTGNGQYSNQSTCQSSCVSNSWDCDGQGNCSDPGTGNGTYSSLSACQSNCVTPSWYCNGVGGCYDPGTGLGFYSSLANCQSNCISPSWDCDGQGNCSDPGTGNGQYSNQFFCQQNCIVPSWDCDGQGNCSDPGTGNGTYASLTACQSSCVSPSWDCNGQGSCSDPGTGNGQYSNQSTCQQNCIVPSWDCDGQGSCSDPGTGNGQYSNQSFCQQNCIVPSWDCDGQGSCFDPGTGNGQYATQSACQQNCIVPSWDCDGQGSCSDPGTGNGQYSNQSLCQQNCIVPSWDCDGQGNCSDPGTSNGTYGSLTACQSNCITPSWDCDGQGNCSDPGTGNGTYSSLTACQSSCVSNSWDCDGQGNCSDPGTGNGTYASLTACQSSCVSPSWDCDGQGNCSDPGTGNGQYSSLISCETECSYVSVYEIGLTNFKIYPNPSKDIFNVSLTSENKRSIEIRLVNLVGKIIFTENLENFEGEYTHSFNLSEYSKGIYLLELDTDNGIVNKKLILQ